MSGVLKSLARIDTTDIDNLKPALSNFTAMSATTSRSSPPTSVPSFTPMMDRPQAHPRTTPAR
ncbi:MAG: hypothetical protein MZU95_15830 [Desulfomicrobium escambiense]|nr:hypothetical protein [Desulfomicrobium escambiense]